MKTAKLFQNGESQAVRLPKEFRLAGTEVFIKKVGNATVLIPMDNPWKSLFNSIPEFTSDYMCNRNQPEEQTRDSF